MPAGQLDGIIRQLRKVALLGQGAELDDAQLLERFLTHRDEEAFEVLLRRHAPMVLGVCRRVLRNEADAEDAFQATFVVFVRKAASIQPRAKVANWLYGVAHKAALKAKAMNTRRRLKERAAGAAALPNARDDTWASLRDMLDDELSVLPEKYRIAIVLCDLEGLSYREAAARLGCRQGTLSGRLTRARQLLARRMTRHGRTLSAGALATLLTGGAQAAIAPSLLAGTIRAGVLLATGAVLPPDALSTKIASLAEGVMQMMLPSKRRILTGVVLFLAAALVVGWIQAGGAARTPVFETGAAPGQTRSPEAEFIFRGADRGKKTVSVVVAGTAAPVLNLPVTADLRILAGGQRVGIDRLRPGTRVALRMEPTNRAIQEIRALADGRPMAVLSSAPDLTQFQLPTTEEVLRSLPRAAAGLPWTCEVFRDDIKVTFERVVHKIDPPRFFPLVGPARLHHCHWKCTVGYTETVTSSYPFPLRIRRPRVEVIYIDKDYLVVSK